MNCFAKLIAAAGVGSSLMAVLPSVKAEGLSEARFDVPQLMELLSQSKQRKDCFREEKTSELLSDPLLAYGTLEFTAPDHLAKIIQQPEYEKFVAQGDRLNIENAQGKKSVSLSNYPALQAFVAGFSATLAGDVETLKRHYAVELEGQAQQWTLRLTPLNSDMRERIQVLRITGGQQHIAAIETSETSGDRSILEILPKDACKTDS